MTREQQLVVLDERFILWLSADTRRDINKRYIIVHETPDGEVAVASYDTLKQIEADIEATIEDKSSWQFVALFDTQGRPRELSVVIKSVITIK